MVGCVIVRDGIIIGEGFHERFGQAHAEVNAIDSAKGNVAGADVYVNLEPCSFFGKTPPCTDLLISKRVRKVCIGMLDPNPSVNGNGVRKLREAGIQVEVGVLREEAERLNEAFTKYITTRLPFVVLKIAQSLDGKIALWNGKSKYITSQESLEAVHELRSRYDAVLVGAGTIRADDPQLNVRYGKGRSPVKVILDGRLSSDPHSRVFTGGRTIVFYSAAAAGNSKAIQTRLRRLEEKGTETFAARVNSQGRISIKAALRKLAELGISSVMVEGGSDVFSQFIKQHAADKFHIFIAPKIMGKGKSFADGIELTNLPGSAEARITEAPQYGADLLITGYFKFK